MDRKQSLQILADDKTIREQLKLIARISNAHRGPEAKKTLELFEQGLDQTISFSPLIKPVLQRFIQLATYGSEKQLGKQFNPSEVRPTRNFAKIHFDYKPSGCGVYKNKWGIHINIEHKPMLGINKKPLFNSGKDLVSSVFHEMFHFIINEKFGTTTPPPPERWKFLGDQIASSIDTIMQTPDEFGITPQTIPDHLILMHNAGYDSDKWVDELPPMLLQHIFLFEKLPFTEENKNFADSIHKLFQDLIKNIKLEIKGMPLKITPVQLYQKILAVKTPTEIKNFASSLPGSITRRSMGLFPLHIAASQNNINLLQELIKSIDVNETDKLHNTALHYALKNNQTEAVAFLIAQNANLLARDEQGMSPIQLAKKYNKNSITLLEKAIEKSKRIDSKEEVKSFATTNPDKFTDKLNLLMLKKSPPDKNLIEMICSIYFSFQAYLSISQSAQLVSSPEQQTLIAAITLIEKTINNLSTESTNTSNLETLYTELKKSVYDKYFNDHTNIKLAELVYAAFPAEAKLNSEPINPIDKPPTKDLQVSDDYLDKFKRRKK